MEAVHSENPPPLVPYLLELFEFHNPDKASSDSIPASIFGQLMSDLFIHVFTAYDMAKLQKVFKTDGDGMVSWSEAIDYLHKHLKILRSTQKHDLWVGLREPNGAKRFFWYNIRNDWSFWMSDTEASQYAACLGMPPAERPSKWLLPTAARDIVAPVSSEKVADESSTQKPKALRISHRRRFTFEDEQPDSGTSTKGRKSLRQSFRST
jgi:hypothetical protein